MMRSWLTVTMVIGLAVQSLAKAPIVFLNGVGGTTVYLKLNKPSVEHEWCDLTSPWYNVWINPEELAPLVIDCTIDNLVITFDPETLTYSNAAGVDVNATTDFGGFDSMMYLDPTEKLIEPYMADFVTHFTGLGWVVGTDLLGAPYDWRYAADSQAAYFLKLKALIENATTTNGMGVTLVAHSMGGLMSLKFLQSQTAAWKQKFIKSYVPLDAPWGGAMNALMGVISGYNFGVSILPHDWFRPLQVHTPAMAFFLPVPGAGSDGTFPNTQVLVSTPDKNYTAADIPTLLQDEGLDNFPSMYQQIAPLLAEGAFGAPAVNTYIIYGTNVTTVCGLQYSDDFVPGTVPPAPANEYMNCNPDGDGTVNINSLMRGELSWIHDPLQTGFTLNFTRFAGMEHMDAVKDPRTLAYITALIQSY